LIDQNRSDCSSRMMADVAEAEVAAAARRDPGDAFEG